MSHTRLLVWGGGRGKGHSSSTNLAALPPTRGIHQKREEGTFSGSFMAINQPHPRAKPRGIWMEEGHSKQDTMPHFFTVLYLSP